MLGIGSLYIREVTEKIKNALLRAKSLVSYLRLFVRGTFLAARKQNNNYANDGD